MSKVLSTAIVTPVRQRKKCPDSSDGTHAFGRGNFRVEPTHITKSRSLQQHTYHNSSPLSK